MLNLRTSRKNQFLQVVLLLLSISNSYSISKNQFIEVTSSDLTIAKPFVYTNKIASSSIIFKMYTSIQLIEISRLYFFTKSKNLEVSIIYSDSSLNMKNGYFLTKFKQINSVDIDTNNLIKNECILLKVSSSDPNEDVLIELSLLKNRFLVFNSSERIRFFYNLSLNEKLYVFIKRETMNEGKDDNIFLWRNLEGSINNAKYYSIDKFDTINSLKDLLNQSNSTKIKNEMLILSKENKSDVLIEISSKFNYPIGYIYYRNIISFDDDKQFVLDIDNFNILKFTEQIKINYEPNSESFLKFINLNPDDTQVVKLNHKEEIFELTEVRERNIQINSKDEVIISSELSEGKVAYENAIVFVESYNKLDQTVYNIVSLEANQVSYKNSKNFMIFRIYINPQYNSKNNIVFQGSKGIFTNIEYSVHRHYKRSADIDLYEIYDYIDPDNIEEDNNLNNITINKNNQRSYFSISIDDIADDYDIIVYVNFSSLSKTGNYKVSYLIDDEYSNDKDANYDIDLTKQQKVSKHAIFENKNINKYYVKSLSDKNILSLEINNQIEKDCKIIISSSKFNSSETEIKNKATKTLKYRLTSYMTEVLLICESGSTNEVSINFEELYEDIEIGKEEGIKLSWIFIIAISIAVIILAIGLYLIIRGIRQRRQRESVMIINDSAENRRNS